MSSAGPNFYDVLDVDAGASTEEIHDAWRAAIADLTPADRRFRLYNQAAEVLLDDERRAAYDAELAAQPSQDEPAAEVPPPAPAPTPRAAPAPTAPGMQQRRGPAAVAAGLAERLRRRRPRRPGTARHVPTWLLAVVALLAVLSVALASYLFTQPSEASAEDAAASARSAAERAIVPVLSYDYRTLAEDQQAAHAYLTSDYRPEYDQLFEGVVTPNARRTRSVVEAEFVASSVVRGSTDRVELLLFVDQNTTNASTQRPVVYRNQVRVFMVQADDTWLVDCLITQPDGRCPS